MVSALIGKPITWILALALILRLWGIWYALPQFFVNDERAIVYGALKMFELKTLVPAWHAEEFKKVLNYLPVSSYIYVATLAPVLGAGYLFSAAENLTEYQTGLVLDPTLIFVAARMVIAFMAVFTIYLAYRFARELFSSERAALLTAIFLTLSFYHVQLSQVTRQWMPALFFMSFAWLAALRIYRRGSVRDYLWGGLFSGISVGANTAAATVMTPILLGHLLRGGGGAVLTRFRDRQMWLGIGLFLFVAALFIALWPFGLSQGEVPGGGAREALTNKLVNLSQKSLGEWFAFMWFYIRLLLRYETVLFVAALSGMILAFRRERNWVIIGALFIIGYLTLLYLFFNIIPRGALFFLPLLAVFAGYGVDRILLKAQAAFPPTLITAAFLFLGGGIILFAGPLVTVLRYDYLLTQPDTRILAQEWLYQHTPAETKILADLPALRLTNTKAGIRALEAIDPSGLRIQDRILLALPDERYPERAREVLNLHFISPGNSYRTAADKKFFTAQGYRFFTVEYEYLNQRDLLPQSRTLAGQGKLVARFSNSDRASFARALDISGEIATVPPWGLWEINRFGTIVDVYEL